MTKPRRNVALLTASQALFMINTSVLTTVGTLAGYALAADKGLATLPVTGTVVGTALGTFPAAAVMRRAGRRLGFVVGCGVAMTGALAAATGLGTGRFWLLVAGTLLVGFSSAFAQLYRFAAAEAAEPGRGGRAIAIVLAGGLAAGFVGPQLARATADLLPTRFLGSYLAVPLLAVAAVPLLLALDLPRPAVAEARGAIRPLAAIVRQPLFVVAALSQMTGYAVMNLLMTGTPLAMTAHHGHPLGAAAFVIQWHIVGMFLPGFGTGTLIQRVGERRTILAGIAANGLGLVAGFSGTSIWHFWVTLVLVGVGWNLMFVAGSALVTRTYRPAERGRAQAANDCLIWSTVAVSSVASGQLLFRHGWSTLVLTAASLVLLAGAAVSAAWPAGALGVSSTREDPAD